MKLNLYRKPLLLAHIFFFEFVLMRFGGGNWGNGDAKRMAQRAIRTLDRSEFEELSETDFRKRTENDWRIDS